MPAATVAGGLLSLLLFSVVTAHSAPPSRVELSLNGAWEYQLVRNLNAPPKDGRWKSCTVPGLLRGYDYQRAWFQHTFTPPADMRGKRIQLRFGGVKYNSRVYLNGQRVGGCFGGYRPFEVDVTGTIQWDRPNLLRVGCHDWTGVFAPGTVDFSAVRDWSSLRQVPRDKILSPVGGLFDHYGLWDDVTLVAREPVYLKDLFIQPSVRHHELVVECTIANEGSTAADIELNAAVEEQDRPVLVLGKKRLRVLPGETVVTPLRAPWPKPHLWSHEDPHLYFLRASLSSGDALRTRFGFREFWIEGHNFYLNGRQVHLLATAGWPRRVPTDAAGIRRTWEGIKAAGCVAFRTHTQPWRKIYYDLADEVGLLIIIEGAVFNDDMTYRIYDPVFWDNYAKHLQAMVAHHKNHPSVVMWSLENEFWGQRMNDESPAKTDLVRMGQIVKQADPTRPIFYESDGDPGGVADVIGIHYPHEYPFYTCWPNEAWWLAQPQEPGRRFHNGAKEFFWRQDKPLYVGEFLWIPSHDPSWNTVFFGDEAYRDYRRYRNLAKAESWKMQILGYRHFEVGGMCPWTMMESGAFDAANPLYQAVRYAYQHVAAYCHDYDRRFYAGDQVHRRVEVFNDILSDSQLNLEWTLSAANKVVDQGTKSLQLAAGGQRLLNVVLSMPEVKTRTPAQWHLRLRRNGQTVFEDEHAYVVYPRIQLAKVTARIGVFDPRGKTRALFDHAGLDVATVGRLDQLDRSLEVLVIGAGALRAGKKPAPIIGWQHPLREALRQFANRGGRVLVLEQAAYPEGLFDWSPSDQQSTMTFPQLTGHPALRQLAPEDLKFWRGNHLVADKELPRPEQGGAQAIVVSGSVSGIDHTALLEQPVGRGCFLFSQLKLVEKFDTEPAAARILSNLVEYLAAYQPSLRKTGVIGGSADYRARLAGLGLRFDDLTDRGDDLDLQDYSLILCRGTLPRGARLRRFVERGGHLLAHRLAPAALANLRRAFDLDLETQPYPGPVSRAEGAQPLLAAVTREDVYWLAQPIGGGASTTPRANEMTDGIFTRSIAGKSATVHEIEDWHITGPIVEKRPPGVTFATTGTASAPIDFPATGVYVIALVGRGTPAFGTFPVAEVAIDDQPLGQLSVASERWQTNSTFGRIEQGRHKVSVSFINDRSNPPNEDRNLYVDKVLIARVPHPEAVTFLTRPPATAVIQYGQGTLVADQLRWDTEPRNTRKAQRYASSLLTALGGDFVSRIGVTLECEQMTPQPGKPQIHQQRLFMALASNGYIETTLRVAVTGNYLMELVASGSPAENIYPLVEVELDGHKAGAIQLTQDGWRAYPLEMPLTQGRHQLRLAFVNDRYLPGVADRNVQLDKVVFYRKD